MSRRGPLADSYPGAVALVVFSLVPYLMLTAAVFPLALVISKSIGLTPHAFDVTVAVSTGAYAAGTVLAVQFAVHLAQRRLLLLYESLFVVASCLAAAAPDAGVFVGAFIVQGLCTSLMLIGAVPPLVMRGVTAFLVAPILVFLAGVIASGATAGLKDALWICLGIAAAGFLGGIAVYLTGQRGLQQPDLERWQGEGEAAWGSPRMFDRLRAQRAGSAEPANGTEEPANGTEEGRSEQVA